MAHIVPTFVKQIFDIPQRQREQDIHHHLTADHVWRCLEIASRLVSACQRYTPTSTWAGLISIATTRRPLASARSRARPQATYLHIGISKVPSGSALTGEPLAAANAVVIAPRSVRIVEF